MQDESNGGPIAELGVALIIAGMLLLPFLVYLGWRKYRRGEFEA